MRARRLGVAEAGFSLLPENRVASIVETARRRKPDVVVVDSIQTVHGGDGRALAGSVAQVRGACASVVALCKETTYGTDAYVRDFTLRYLPEVSHWVQQDDPDTVNAMLEAWLTGEPVLEAP